MWVSLEDHTCAVRDRAEQLPQEDSSVIAGRGFSCSLAMQILTGGLVFSPAFSETV